MRCPVNECDVVRRWTETWAGEHVEHMTESQMAWCRALGRPLHDEAMVLAGLQRALQYRGLDWSLRRYDSARDARAAWVARAANVGMAFCDAWATWAASDARAAWLARRPRDARHAWDAWTASDVKDASDAMAVRAARAALVVEYAALRGWVDYPADLLTVGMRDAYEHGLGIAMPIGDGTYGWAMEGE